jgi:hypothetical protein
MKLPRLRFTIRQIVIAVAVIAIALGLSVDVWMIIVPALTLGALGVAVLGVRFHRGYVRAFCAGVATSGSIYFLFFASPTFARGAAQSYQHIAQSIVTIPVAAAGGSAASLCYHCYSKSMRGTARHPAGDYREQSGRM